MHAEYYLNQLYPLQDKALESISKVDDNFYLTGGTAISRIYLHHRYSDDLDLFVNQLSDFKEITSLIVMQLSQDFDRIKITIRQDSFLRAYVSDNETELKIEFINDVGYHYDGVIESSIFRRVDNWQNILSNKVTALSRQEGKDCSDILYMCFKYDFIWKDIIDQAQLKDMWVNELDATKLIEKFTKEDLKLVNWIAEPDYDELLEKLQIISRDILLGGANSLCMQKKI
jgi:predicted nucleotidyltransferase component of viral defense system